MNNPGGHQMLWLFATKCLGLSKHHYFCSKHKRYLSCCFLLWSLPRTWDVCFSLFVSPCPCAYLSFTFFLYLIHFLCCWLYHTNFFYLICFNPSSSFLCVSAILMNVKCFSFIRTLPKGFSGLCSKWKLVVTSFAHPKEIPGNPKKILIF